MKKNLIYKIKQALNFYILYGWAKSHPEVQLEIKEKITSLQRRTYGVAVALCNKDLNEYLFSEDEEKRIRYYLGDIEKKGIQSHIKRKSFGWATRPSMVFSVRHEDFFRAFKIGLLPVGITLPVLNIFNLIPEKYKKKTFLFIHGDNRLKRDYKGILVKARQIGDSDMTLLKLNIQRHWQDLHKIKPLDIDYKKKKDAAIWRGVTTGDTRLVGRRVDLVKMFFDKKNLLDVGFSGVVQGQNQLKPLVKDKKSIREQLKYKFLISLEGNDVASGLMWMLCSNSVVLMPQPTTESWLMEGKLEPFVHYIPLKDNFSDIEAQLNWALEHEKECLEISKNASQYMQQFLDPRKEVLMECEVMRRYLDNLTLIKP